LAHFPKEGYLILINQPLVSNLKCDSVDFSAGCTTAPPSMAGAYRQLGRHRSPIHREIGRNTNHSVETFNACPDNPGDQA
jgi:hypothetical protein